MHETKARLRTTWRLCAGYRRGGCPLSVGDRGVRPDHARAQQEFRLVPAPAGRGDEGTGVARRDAPFDVVKFFAAVPRDQNAAPLYLDALFEFGSELEDVFSGRDRTLASEPGRQGSVEAVPWS